jgi:hypothetical protein
MYDQIHAAASLKAWPRYAVPTRMEERRSLWLMFLESHLRKRVVKYNTYLHIVPRHNSCQLRIFSILAYWCSVIGVT